jgi:hypothetical protein
MNYDEFIEHLYDLDQEELRMLAYEALLISDGPAAIDAEGVTPAGVAAVLALWPEFRDVPAPMMYWKVPIKSPHEIAAEKVRDQVAEKMGGTQDAGPVVFEAAYWGGPDGYYGVAWDGGPWEWALIAHEYITVPDGYFAEAVNNCTLGVYPT